MCYNNVVKRILRTYLQRPAQPMKRRTKQTITIVIAIIVTALLAGPARAFSAPMTTETGLPPLFTAPTVIKPLEPLKLAEMQPLAPLPYPVAGPGTYQNDYAWGNCTWYVAGRKQVPANLGNANTWAYMAAQDGLTTSTTPLVGAVGATTAGWLGHVVIVEAVQGDQVEVTEMNVQGLGVADEAWYPASYFTYIYT